MTEAELHEIEERATAFRTKWERWRPGETVDAVTMFHLAEVYESEVLRLIARIRELEGRRW